MHGGLQSGQQGEVRPLAHVVTLRARSIGVGIVDQAREVGGAFAGDPVLLQRRAAAPVGRGIEEAGGIGPEQPLVSCRHREIRPNLAHVECHRAAALRQVQHKRGADLAATRADGDEVDAGPIRPAHLRAGDQSGVRGDGAEQGFGERLVAARRDRFDHRAALACVLAPRIDVGRELVLEQQDLLALRQRQVASRCSEAVAGRGHEGDACLVRTDQGGEQRTQPPGVLEKVRVRNGPGPQLARQTALACFRSGHGQRAHGRDIEVGDIGRDVEQVTLIGDQLRHRVRRSGCPCCPSTGHGSGACTACRSDGGAVPDQSRCSSGT